MKARKSKRWRELTEEIEQRQQEFIDRDKGTPYRFGDDDDIDNLHEERLSLMFDETVSVWPEAFEEASEIREAELEKLKWPEVTQRLTRHERIRRGFTGAKKA